MYLLPTFFRTLNQSSLELRGDGIVSKFNLHSQKKRILYNFATDAKINSEVLFKNWKIRKVYEQFIFMNIYFGKSQKMYA